MDEAERRRRKLTPHAWRHFLNTMLRSNGVSDAKIQTITGHSSAAMTDYYTDFRVDDLQEVKGVQSILLGGSTALSVTSSAVPEFTAPTEIDLSVFY
ncbi:MAG: site-specific integrase, partial [Spirochaetaceae bacterium]|nr:site-specific integrase [Spirochaetaceae bacterium]